MSVVIEKQATPNPMAFKFIMDTQLVAQGSLSYACAEESTGQPVAAALFEIEGVLSVYLKNNFIAITAPDWAAWDRIEATVSEQMAEFQPVEIGNEEERGIAVSTSNEQEAELLEVVNEIMDLYVRPALAQDGGGIEIISVENKVFTMRYHGACGGCPSASAGTLNAIQSLLQKEADPQIELIAY